MGAACTEGRRALGIAVVATSLDGRLAVWVATHRYAPLNGLFVALGTIDKIGAVWIGLALLIALLSHGRVSAAIGVAMVAALATFAADSLSFGVKDLAHRARPFIAHPQIHPLYTVHSSSFPAGHAATAFAGATLLAYLAPRATPLFIALALAIGYSRVYLGVHYPGDVLAGAALGVLVGVVAILLLALTRDRFGRHLAPLRAQPAPRDR
jgi:undecaprenyl-diphosphatase